MIIRYNVTGNERKRLVKALGKIMMQKPEYVGAPSFAYKVRDYLVDKNGAIECPPFVTTSIADRMVKLMEEEGFTPEAIEGTPFTVSIPKETLTDGAQSRLKQIIHSKATLFKHAFKTENVLLEECDERISFPWFMLYGDEGETKAYTDFVFALLDMAENRKRITAKPYEGNNDKFYMRLFLVQLGLKGEKYKTTRKILLKYLTGNSAWRDGAPPENGDVK